jgi:acyl-CoA hydrolase
LAEDAASLINHGMAVGMSGFTGSGYPKAVPSALAARIEADDREGRPSRVKVWTGASTGPDLDGALARADGIELRLPYNSDPVARERINAGEMDYLDMLLSLDMHLSQVAPMAWQGFLGPLDVAVIEVTAILADGSLVPSSSVGSNKTWLDRTDKVILEVNRWRNPAIEGMHPPSGGALLVPILHYLVDLLVGRPGASCRLDPQVNIVRLSHTQVHESPQHSGDTDAARVRLRRSADSFIGSGLGETAKQICCFHALSLAEHKRNKYRLNEQRNHRTGRSYRARWHPFVPLRRSGMCGIRYPWALQW